MLMPLNLTGGTYKHKSLPLSAQITRNFWPQKQQDSSTQSEYVLESFPGLKLFGTKAGGNDRGMLEHLGILYKVTGTKLCTVSVGGTHTELGTIPGSSRCIMEGIGSSIVIVTDGVPYVWNGSTLTTVNDADLETPNSCAHLNNQILYDGDGGRFCSSDVGDATSIDGLNYATAESNADDLIRVYVFKQLAYMLGDKTTEPWWNSGSGNPPFDRREQGIIPVGLAALHAVANNDNFMYMLADDRQVYRISDVSYQPITPHVITREFASYETVSDAIGWCMNYHGQELFVLTFPTESKTWVYPENGEWFEWSFGAKGGRSKANSYAYAFGKHLIGDFQNGNIYELDDNTYTDNGSPIIRTRITGPLHGGLIGFPGKRMEMQSLKLLMGTGIGILSGQGSDPEVMISFSDDGGRTYSTEMRGKVGSLGQYQYEVEWNGLGQFENRLIKVSVSDPCHYTIFYAAAEVDICI